MSSRFRCPGGAGLAIAGVFLALCGQPGWALNPTSSASFRIDRTSVNSGSAVRASSGGTYQVIPHVLGAPAVGRSTSASYAVNHGRIGGLNQIGDDVFVDPLWASQLDVDNDPTVGLAGCKKPPFGMIFGVNAFQTITDAVAAVNDGGRVHVMNGTIAEEAIALAKRVQIIGENEAFGTCTGLVGRDGALVTASTAYSATKPIFHVQSADVSISDLQVDGDNTLIGGATEADFGIYASDASGALNNLVVRNVAIRNFADHGVYLALPNTSGHVIETVDFQFLGDAIAGGSAQGGAVLFAGASGRVTSGTVTLATTGVSVYGDAPGSHAAVVGTGAQPVVTVEGTDFLSIGGATGGEGAIAYLYNAGGSINNNTIEAAERGIQVGSKFSPDTLVVANNALVGPMQTGIDVHDIYAAPAEVVGSTVEVAGNSLSSTFDDAGIALRFIGQDSGGLAQNLGSVVVDSNELINVSGTVTPMTGVFVTGVDPVNGTVQVTSNMLDVASGALVDSAVMVASSDLIFGVGGALDSDNVAIDGNAISGWTNGVRVHSTSAPGSVALAASVGLNEPNDISGSANGVFVGQDANVEIGSTIAGVQRIWGNQVGISVDDSTGMATISGNLIEENTVAGVRVSNGGNALIENNTIMADTTTGAVGVLAAAGGGTIDLGNGAFGSLGGNTIGVNGSDDNWAVSIEAAGLYSAENNIWQYAGATYNGPVAVDDLIKDGDADNPVAGGEGFTMGPLDFIPFQAGTLEAAITTDDDFVRGSDAGYGVTQFRALADAIEAVAVGGVSTLEDGVYLSKRYDVSSNYNLDGMPIAKAMTLQGVSPSGAVIVPATDGVGTAVNTVREAGSRTLIEVESDDVTISSVVLDGDNPAVPGLVTINGIDINARNGAVIVASAGDGPDNVVFDNVTVRNLYYRGIVSDPSVGNNSQAVEVRNSAFNNIDGFQNINGASGAVELTDVRSSVIADNIIGVTRRGVILTANDSATTHVVSGNVFANIDDRAISAGSASNNSHILVTGNTVSSQNTGLEIGDVTAGGTVEASFNFIAAQITGINAYFADSTSLISIHDNTVDGLVSGTGIRTYSTATSGPGTGVEIRSNNIREHLTGVMISNTAPGLPAAANTGTVLANNTIENNTTGVNVSDSTGSSLYALIGGPDYTSRNFIRNNTTGIRVSGAVATADILNNGSPVPGFVPVIENNATGILVSSNAAARIVGNRFDGSSSAAIRVTDAGTEALIETNEMRGTTNQVGIHIENDAIASMGPGPSATPISDPFFGGVESIGLNKLRDYAGLLNYAIHNESALDQNAENNDFNTLNLLTIETVVEHRPDNGQGIVFFDPPSNQFVNVEDWYILN